MKHMLVWFWHGENVGIRILRGLIGAGAVVEAAGVPTDGPGWAKLVSTFLLVAAVSKSEAQAAKLGRK